MPYLLSTSDVAVLRSLVEEDRNRPQNTTQRSLLSIEREESLAPEVYVARTPPTGIPAMGEGPIKTTGTGDLGTETIADDPGFSDCDIYRLDFEQGGIELEIAGFSELVFNISRSPISGNTFILIVRDKFGQWFAVTGGGDGQQDHFDARIVIDIGLGAYLIEEQYPPGTNKPAGRIVTAKEFNLNSFIAVGTKVTAWIFNALGSLSYWFEYCCGNFPPPPACAPYITNTVAVSTTPSWSNRTGEPAAGPVYPVAWGWPTDSGFYLMASSLGTYNGLTTCFGVPILTVWVSKGFNAFSGSWVGTLLQLDITKRVSVWRIPGDSPLFPGQKVIISF